MAFGAPPYLPTSDAATSFERELDALGARPVSDAEAGFLLERSGAAIPWVERDTRPLRERMPFAFSLLDGITKDASERVVKARVDLQRTIPSLPDLPDWNTVKLVALGLLAVLLIK